ncbi:hypothetical protein NQ317_006466 [Molorchus minor]|uniref:SMP-30/Gluconolactonase/LRE-like region domain-containing protein n=1 Tax=Molorchus minor TaxID=1323400 RepID=A0ABQ9J6Z6_9CUCU|nr:hypothetical protein NQ317_006466 [Molorchus minor]
MAPNVEKVIDNNGIQLGEGPHWDSKTQALYFVNYSGQHIHKYVPATKKHTKANIALLILYFSGKSVSFVIPVENKENQFVIATENEVSLIQWDGKSEKVSILETLFVDPNNAFNDGKCDPSGRLWTGTIAKGLLEGNGSPTGNLYSFQNKKSVSHLSEIGLSNGLAFDVNLNKFYYVDSYKGTLDQYDFDVTTGRIGLDGMAVDYEGNLWVAVFNGSKVIKIDPRKPEAVVKTIQIPTKQIKMAPKVEKVIDNANTGIQLGEGPHWDSKTQALYFVNYFGQHIHKYVPATKKNTQRQT